MMSDCRIIYGATSIKAEYCPGLANFSYWLYSKIPFERWKQTGEGIRLGCEVTEAEADYIKQLSTSQWGQGSCEVIGGPEVKAEPKPAIKLMPRPIVSEDPDQLSLFEL